MNKKQGGGFMTRDDLQVHLQELRRLAIDDPSACEQKRTEIITAFLASYEPHRRAQLVELQEEIDHMRKEHEHDPCGFLEKLRIRMIASVRELSEKTLDLAHCAVLMAMAKRAGASHIQTQEK
jgi:hypothetical protein